MPRSSHRLPVSVGLLVLLGTAACGGAAHGTGATATTSAPSVATGSSAAATANGSVVVAGNNALRFVPMVVHVHTGKVRITLVDDGAYPHNVQIPSLHFTSPTVTGSPGETRKTFTVDFPHPGRYAFRCQYHYTAGMVGTFVAS